MTLTDLLLRRPEVTWAGRYYSVEEARTYPGCVQQPRLPLAVAAGGPAGMRLAAHLGDFWVTLGDPSTGPLGPADGAQVVATQIHRLEDACREAGRDQATLRKLALSGSHLDPGLSSPGAFRETMSRYEEAGVTDFVVHWPRGSEPYAADPATFERIFGSRGE